MVDLETDNTVDASKTIKPAIKPRAKDHDLTNPVCQSLEHNIVDEARPSNSRRSCTWSSSIRIPSDRYCEERNSAKNSGPPQRRSQKVDCKWIRKETPSTRTRRLHGTVKGHVFRSSTGSRRFHLRPVRIAAFASQLVRRVVGAPHYLRFNCQVTGNPEVINSQFLVCRQYATIMPPMGGARGRSCDVTRKVRDEQEVDWSSF